MLTQEPTPEMFEEWKSVWHKYKNFLTPNRKSGQELLDYLSHKYVLTETHDKEAADSVRFNVTINKTNAEKLPNCTIPQPLTFCMALCCQAALSAASDLRTTSQAHSKNSWKR